ncbi:aminotransferase class I/II-fold pyridoxal phosphate-dependent enzyme [Streptomyces sp. NPDC006624]|uniref:DegT/DnrJ/EryC1/StrS family aminotransferase n=1 Tax=Streptomyces sp. NPDC006624 TaxID=3154892 RepID=UPI0033B2B059
MNAGVDPALMQALEQVLARMPDPAGRREAEALESELASVFGARHAVVVASGTSALHTAVVACGIGPGDEVLMPATTVIMTVEAVAATGATPVFVDCAPGGGGIDLKDLSAKRTRATRAILPVHLAGRTDGIHELAAYAQATGLRLIEDACQAQGSRTRGRQAGTIGHIGCFSLKDGKIISSGEGGYLLTDDPELAARAAAFRTHWHTPAPEAPAGSRLGLGLRLAEPLAAIARHQLAAFDDALARRRHQCRMLHELVDDTPGLVPNHPPDEQEPNGYSALWHLTLDRPRAFSARLAEQGVTNSVGTFGLRTAPEHPACRELGQNPCPNAARAVDRLLAVPFTARMDEEDLHQIAATIRREAAQWTS